MLWGHLSVVRRVVGALALVGVVAGQDLSVPSNWSGSTTSTDSRPVREAFANDAAKALVQNIASTGSLSNTTESQALASMYTVLAQQDLLSANTTWKDTVTANIKTWTGQIDIFGNGTAGSKRTNSNGIQWALAYFYTYKAYGDSSFLTLAKNAFDTTYGSYITPPVAKAKEGGPGRNISFNASGCFDSAAGGIFWLPDVPDNSQIQADTVGPFSVLAGLLYEETKNETYKTLGQQSAQFMGGLLLDEHDVELGVVDVGFCLFNTGRSPGLQGWYVYALSIWANITSDSDLTGKLRTAVSIAAHSTDWTETDGILLDTQTFISDAEFDDKAILVRALSETIRRFPTSGDLVQFIKAFLNVQYNAATNNARSGSSYAQALFGPPPATFSNNGNLVALDVLNAAFDMIPKNASSSSSSGSSPSGTSAPSQTSSTSSSTPVGAIAGGVVGGVAGLAALVGVVFLWRRRNQRQRDNSMREPFDGDKSGNASYEHSPNAPPVVYAVEPFLANSSGNHSFSAPMSSPQFNDSHTTGLSGIQSTSTAPSSNGTQLRAVNDGNQAPAGYSSKLARMNAPPPPLPRGASSPSVTQVSPPASDSAQGADAGSSSAQSQDIPALVGRLVNDLLREHGSVPPQYEER
ncbi:unnamed protein product [Peniophora sp. CBMAI 1063]|nr:unnamed protein product [Peniophora sp. CBMAI 1063]